MFFETASCFHVFALVVPFASTHLFVTFLVVPFPSIQVRLGRFGCVWCSIVVRVVSIVVVFNGCSVQLFVLCQLLQCSIVECVKLLQCSIVACVVSVVVVFSCCSVQLCLLLLHFVFTSHVPICLQF